MTSEGPKGVSKGMDQLTSYHHTEVNLGYQEHQVIGKMCWLREMINQMHRVHIKDNYSDF